jgi:hypothetical protein
MAEKEIKVVRMRFTCETKERFIQTDEKCWWVEVNYFSRGNELQSREVANHQTTS